MTNKCKYHLIFTSYTRGDEKGKLSGFRTKTHKLCIIISEAQLLRYISIKLPRLFDRDI